MPYRPPRTTRGQCLPGSLAGSLAGSGGDVSHRHAGGRHNAEVGIIVEPFAAGALPPADAHLPGVEIGLHGSSSSYAADFHDITGGNNDYCYAGTGWDPVTGIGTPQVASAIGGL